MDWEYTQGIEDSEWTCNSPRTLTMFLRWRCLCARMKRRTAAPVGNAKIYMCDGYLAIYVIRTPDLAAQLQARSG